MTVTTARPVFSRRPHRAHPQHFPHPVNCTIRYCVDETEAAAEPGTMRFTSTEAMLDAVRRLFTARLATMQSTGRPLRIDDTTYQALVVHIDNPLELLADETARRLVQEIIWAADGVGIYPALAITPAEQKHLREETTWGTAILEYLRRDQAGYPVYGCW